MKLYKVLAVGRKSCHGGRMVWEPFHWYEISGDLIPCQNGFHLCRPEDLLDWLQEEIWKGQVQRGWVYGDGKIVAEKARITWQCLGWNNRTARLFAADCVQNVAHLCTLRSVQRYIETTRRFAEGAVSYDDLLAARDAAWVVDKAKDTPSWVAAMESNYVAKEAIWNRSRNTFQTTAMNAARAAAMEMAQKESWAAAKKASWYAALAEALAQDKGDATKAAFQAARQTQTRQLMQYLAGEYE